MITIPLTITSVGPVDLLATMTHTDGRTLILVDRQTQYDQFVTWWMTTSEFGECVLCDAKVVRHSTSPLYWSTRNSPYSAFCRPNSLSSPQHDAVPVARNYYVESGHYFSGRLAAYADFEKRLTSNRG